MTHLKKYWYWYLIAIVVIIAAILAYSNWETVKGWFSSSAPGTGGRIANNTIPVSAKTDCIGGYESVWGVIGSNARKCKNNGDGTYTYI